MKSFHFSFSSCYCTPEQNKIEFPFLRWITLHIISPTNCMCSVPKLLVIWICPSSHAVRLFASEVDPLDVRPYTQQTYERESELDHTGDLKWKQGHTAGTNSFLWRKLSRSMSNCDGSHRGLASIKWCKLLKWRRSRSSWGKGVCVVYFQLV